MRNYWDDIQLAANEELPWEKLSGCNVLVTGATGLIGGCLVEVLMARGDINVYAAGRNETRALSRFAEYTSNPHFHFSNTMSPRLCHVQMSILFNISYMPQVTLLPQPSLPLRWK